MAAEWKLIYWPGMAGRGEFIRLIFEEVGVTYEEVGDCQGIEAVLKYANYSKGECANDGPVIFAPPIIEKDGFRLCQMPAILAYLGKKYGLYPDSSPEDEARCMQINLSVGDYIEDGHNAFHPVRRSDSYLSQKEIADECIQRYKENRIPRYLKYFEALLVQNNGGDGFFFDKLTYVDFAVFNALRVTESQFPDLFSSIDYTPKLKAFKERMAARPKIAAYLKSDRVHPFKGDSMM